MGIKKLLMMAEMAVQVLFMFKDVVFLSHCCSREGLRQLFLFISLSKDVICYFFCFRP